MIKIQFPKSVYVPTYGLTGVAYEAGTPPNTSWNDRDYGPNTAVLDTNAITALDSIVTGPVTSWDQLDAAELAVRAMVLHERIYWLMPSVLVISPQNIVRGTSPAVVEDGGHVVYPRYKEPDAIMDVLRLFGASSYSVFKSYVYVKDNIPIGGDEFWVSNYDRLRSMDSNVVEEVFKESFNIDFIRDSYFASPKAIGAGSYFGSSNDREYESNLMKNRTSALPEKALRLLDENWRDSVSGSGIGLNIRLGPFLAIVLSRSESRNDIPKVITELREEFQKSRKEFWDLFTEPLTERRSVVAIRKLRNMERAIQSIVPASFPSKERPFRFLWDTAHAVADIALTGGSLSAIKFVGESLLNRDANLAQASTISLTKKLTTELRGMEESLTYQLRRLLSAQERSMLGLPM